MKSKFVLGYLIVVVFFSSCLRDDNYYIDSISTLFSEEEIAFEDIHSYFSAVEQGKLISLKLESNEILLTKEFDKIENFKRITLPRNSINELQLNNIDSLKIILDYMDEFEIYSISYSLEEDYLEMYFDKTFWPCIYLVYHNNHGKKAFIEDDKKYWSVAMNSSWYIKKVSCDL